MSPDKRNPEGYPTDPAQRRQEERLEELLGALPEVKAPSSLRAEVMAELRATPPTLGMRFRRWWRGLGAWRVPIQLAPVAALVAVAVIGQDLLQQGPPRPESVGIGLVGEEITTSQMEALGLDLEIAKIPEDAAAAPKPPRTAGTPEMQAALGAVHSEAPGRQEFERNQTESSAQPSPSPPMSEPVAPAATPQAPERRERQMASDARASAPQAEPLASAQVGNATESDDDSAQMPTPSGDASPLRSRGVEADQIAMETPRDGSDLSASFSDLPTAQERQDLLQRSVRLPPPGPAPSQEGSLGQFAATRVRATEGTFVTGRSGVASGTQAPASAMAVNGSGMTADEFRTLRDAQVAYLPTDPTQRPAESSATRLEADVTDAQAFMTALGETLDQLGGRMVDRRALSNDRDVWHVDAQVPRWRLEELRRRVGVLSDPRLLETLTLIEEEEERPSGSLTPSERELVDVQVVVYEHPLDNIP